MAKTTMNEYPVGDVNEIKPIREHWKGIKGWAYWSDALDGKFYKVDAIFLWLKTDFLRQLRLPAANPHLQKEKKTGGAIIWR